MALGALVLCSACSVRYDADDLPRGGVVDGDGGLGDGVGDDGDDGGEGDGGADGDIDASGGDRADAMRVAPPVSLGMAANFAIVAESGITSASPSVIVGDIGVSPIDSTAITGFTLLLDPGGTFSTSLQVDGRVFAANYAAPTPARMATAVLDMRAAFAEAGELPADVSELGGGDIGGMTLPPGVYRWATGVVIEGDVTLDGTAADSWVLDIGEGLTMNAGARIVLSGGAVPRNVFWRVSGLADLRMTSRCEGAVLSAMAATLAAGASVNGRLLSQTAVTLNSNTVVEPAP
jgi:hypothetical protein